MTNRLAHEKSPYLLQHAENPVDWYPWGDEAFAAAREEDKPVFLSIGYATCHWCHVMEGESFEDPEVAALMNEAFVSVKVDREERPDIDGIYMAVAQMLTGHGGWPLTVVMFPDGRPFFAATYIPKATRYGRIGMLDLVPRLAEAWRDRREELTASAAGIHDALARHAAAQTPSAGLGEVTLRQGYVELAGMFDRDCGGFGTAPKFPTPHLMLFLLRYWHRTGADASLAMVRQTLTAMRAGGICDHVGFGFHRYATDRRWLVPHFEKMLYDQATLTLTAVEAWQASGDLAFARMAREVLEYVRRDLTSPEGMWFSAEDADSEGVEGKFYVWTLDELVDVAGDDAELAAAAWGVTAGGNYDEEATRERTGANILHHPVPLGEVAGARELTEDALRVRLEAVRMRLLARRSARVRPLRDDKVLTDWNGLMVAATARAGWVFGDGDLVAAAARAAGALWKTMWRAGELLHRYREGEAAIGGNLDDYAFFAWGALELHQATQDVVHLERALTLTDAMLERFWDAEHGGLYFAPAERSDLLVRMKDTGDGALPSGAAVAMYNLVRLARLTGRQEYEQRAGSLADTSSGRIASHPSSAAFFLVALDFAIGPSQELVVVGDGDHPATRALLDVARTTYLPRLVVLHRPPGDGGRLVELAPAVGAFHLVDGEPAAYLCRNFTCERPVRSPDDLQMLLSRPPS